MTEIKLRAERRAGEILKETPLNSGTRLNGGNTGGPIVQPPVNDAPTLQEVGINKNQSSRWQMLAGLAQRSDLDPLFPFKNLYG